MAVLALMVAACSAPPVPRDQFYRLSGGSPTQRFATPPIEGSLAVNRLRADGLVSQRPILFSTLEHPNRLEQHNYHYWIEIPPVMLRDSLMVYLEQANIAPSIALGDARHRAGCELSANLRRMEHVVSGGQPSTAVIEVQFQLERVNDAAILLNRTYRAEQVALALTVDSTAAAFDQALAALFVRLISDLAAATPTCPAPVS
ncbi:MAG: ABC-type transport auxiliary lipoprotein family protein [Alphaproteobacteria bacterium]|nr:ABC-type transport auxiliary lipoprotein family protein [Alphaproteobacteria bacterium]